jgi:heme A synthase
VSGRDGGWAIALWALFNAGLAALLLGFRNNAVELLSYWGAVGTLVVIVVLARRSRDRPLRRLPEASAGALLLAAAVAFLGLGAGIGLWAALIGAGLAIVAFVTLMRERAG